MKNRLDINMGLASQDMILEVFRGRYLIALEYDPESDPGIPIELETTVSELSSAFDWVHPDQGLGPELGDVFGVDASWEDWLEVLMPSETRTLRDICDFLVSRGARLPVSRPLRIFGTTCNTAGAFAAIRAVMAGEGINVSDLRPSTDLASFVKKRKQLDALLFALSQLAPGALPEPLARRKKPTLRAIVSWLYSLGILGFVCWPLARAGNGISEWLGGPTVPEGALTVLLTVSAGQIACALVGGFLINLLWPTEHVHRPGLETFGDLARAVAAYAPPASRE